MVASMFNRSIERKAGLAVCVAALLVFTAGDARAQANINVQNANDMAAAQEQQEKDAALQAQQAAAPAPAEQAPAEQLPVVQEQQAAPMQQQAAPVEMAAPAPAPEPAPPVPVLDATRPEPVDGIVNTTRIASSAPRTTQRIASLRDAVAVGVLTSPETEAVQNNRRATDEELKQAKALYMPSVDLRAETGWEYTDDVSTRAGLGDDTESLWRKDASITLTQMLFDGFNTHFENQRQKWRVRSAAHRVRETAEFNGLNIVEAYLDVLRQRELLNIATQNLEQHQDILRQIDDGAQAGRSTQADVEQTRARFASARAQESNIRQALRNAESTYQRRVGDLPQPDLNKPLNPRELIAANVDEEVKAALVNSPTLDIFEADVNVAQSEQKGTGSTMYPQVDLQLNGRSGDDLGGVEGRDTSASALVVANWNLFRGGGDTARTREFVYRHAQAKNERNNAARAVEDDVRQTWASMQASAERAEQFSKQASANAEVVQAYKDQFNLDRRTLLDVLDSQNEWFVSRSNTINNQYLEMFAVYRLLALKGRLLPSLEIAYPKEVNPADKS